MMQQETQEHRRRAEHLEHLLQEIAIISHEQTRSLTEDLVQTLLDLYGESLARMLELTAAHLQAEPNQATALIEAFAEDELIGSLLLLHGLHPIPLATRVQRALDAIKGHTGTIELVRLSDGVAYLHIDGNCHGCSSSAGSLQATIEDMLYSAAPDLNGIQIEGLSDQRGSVQPVIFVAPRRQKAGSGGGS
ncbi:NifU family protein [Tengunoibacter tsumagoiensis]|uniref:NIF system FeS cluster assembly NifU C-terminal domain-containing protein n=1 Tax=Tengunoibacter tsumagoiensis TaxID=2014871 RepID=A0A402A152_9CHLR|nr:NifU family protein [Tengunoibacter tsumagoiensis]GCE12786.1 hypothetical protein KTT_26450 [Tengunoibacter tsumagoiensis]